MNNSSNKIENFKKYNIQKCIKWCERNNIPYINTNKCNIFLENKTRPKQNHTDKNKNNK